MANESNNSQKPATTGQVNQGNSQSNSAVTPEPKQRATIVSVIMQVKNSATEKHETKSKQEPDKG